MKVFVMRALVAFSCVVALGLGAELSAYRRAAEKKVERVGRTCGTCYKPANSCGCAKRCSQIGMPSSTYREEDITITRTPSEINCRTICEKQTLPSTTTTSHNCAKKVDHNVEEVSPESIQFGGMIQSNMPVEEDNMEVESELVQ